VLRSPARWPRWAWALGLSVALLLAVLVLVKLVGGRSSAHKGKVGKGKVLAGAVMQADRTWHCNGRIDLRLLRVTMRSGDKGDAVHLDRGCTGVIQRIEIPGNGRELGPSGDGVKVHAGAHDLRVLAGFVDCGAKSKAKHQDAIQVMGGERVTFSQIQSHGCANSFMFINWGRRRHEKPKDVVCEHCRAESRNYSVSVRNSVRSGAVGGSYVSRVPPRATANATDPVLKGYAWHQRPGVSR
jgi:hypothetical protein